MNPMFLRKIKTIAYIVVYNLNYVVYNLNDWDKALYNWLTKLV